MKTKIYFIDNGSEIKIGRSVDVERRIEELQVSNSNKLKILYTIDNVEENFEKHVQGICNKYHIRGEWFKKDVLEFLIKHPFYKENMTIYSTKNKLVGDNESS